ncbi:hypothetical protein JG688_00015485, partial [Phytophthora aleatoria]
CDRSCRLSAKGRCSSCGCPFVLRKRSYLPWISWKRTRAWSAAALPLRNRPRTANMSAIKRGLAVFVVSSRFVGAQLNLTVYLDATYAIDQARGPICGGVGDLPTGTACPYKGDIATADCNSTLPSYNGTDCVAPVDGECVVDAESKWSCVFPNNSDGSKEAEDLSSTLTVSSESSMESPWGDLPWRAPPPLDSPFNAGNRLRRSSELRVK